MTIPISEQETTINIYRDSDLAKVYTTDSTMITKLNKMVKKFPDVFKCTGTDKLGASWYECPKRLISFRGPTAPRTISEEERIKRAEHMRSINKNKTE